MKISELVTSALYLDGAVDVNGKQYKIDSIPSKIAKMTVEGWRATFDTASLKHGLVIVTRPIKTDDIIGQMELIL